MPQAPVHVELSGHGQDGPFQVDMPLRDQLAALALEVKIELALITYFNESIPDPGENWDGRRRYRR